MKIVAISADECNANKIVLITDPPITLPVVAAYRNRGGVAIEPRAGKIVLPIIEYEKIKLPHLKGRIAEELNKSLTLAEVEVGRTAQQVGAVRKQLLEELSSQFGIPLQQQADVTASV